MESWSDQGMRNVMDSPTTTTTKKNLWFVHMVQLRSPKTVLSRRGGMAAT
jgi:hypothetical protein